MLAKTVRRRETARVLQSARGRAGLWQKRYSTPRYRIRGLPSSAAVGRGLSRNVVSIRGDILPNWSKLGFFFAKMGFQFGKMRFEFVPMPFFRRPQQTHAQGKRMVVVTRKPDKGGMSFNGFMILSYNNKFSNGSADVSDGIPPQTGCILPPRRTGFQPLRYCP